MLHHHLWAFTEWIDLVVWVKVRATATVHSIVSASEHIVGHHGWQVFVKTQEVSILIAFLLHLACGTGEEGIVAVGSTATSSGTPDHLGVVEVRSVSSTIVVSFCIRFVSLLFLHLKWHRLGWDVWSVASCWAVVRIVAKNLLKPLRDVAQSFK
jgi:hypothetical protein